MKNIKSILSNFTHCAALLFLVVLAGCGGSSAPSGGANGGSGSGGNSGGGGSGGSGPVANVAPIADAGIDQQLIDTDLDGSESVLLDASNSSDADGDSLGYLEPVPNRPF